MGENIRNPMYFVICIFKNILKIPRNICLEYLILSVPLLNSKVTIPYPWGWHCGVARLHLQRQHPMWELVHVPADTSFFIFVLALLY